MANSKVKKLAGKVALVTGGSRGIGKAVAQAYAREGAKVCICARSAKELKQTAETIRAEGGEISWVVADVGKVREVKRLVREIRRRYNSIDVLVNNASLLGPREPVERYPLASWEEVLRVNLTGVFLMSKEILQIMMRQREGSIINVSSGVGRIGKARWGAYAVSKFGLEGLTQLLSQELKEFDIRVNAVNPGATRTVMRARAYPEEDPRTIPVPEEITGVFVYLASADARGVTGKSFEARDWIGKSR